MTDNNVEQLVRRYADEVISELGCDPYSEYNPTVDPDVEERLLAGVRYSIALAADHDVDLLRATHHALEPNSFARLLCFGAYCAAVEAHRSDADRAAHLARLVNNDIPPSVHAFAPRHARLAADQVVDVNRRLWLLDDFVKQACALN